MPFVIVAALLPSLGFVLLKQPRRALVTAVMMLVPLGLSYFPAVGWLAAFSGNAALWVWLAEIYFWGSTAQLYGKRSRPGFEAARARTPITLPPDLATDFDRTIYRIQETIRQQLRPGENLLAFVAGAYQDAWMGTETMLVFPGRQCYAGLTDTHVVFIEIDLLGVPVVVERLPRQRIERAELKAGVYAYRLQLYRGQKRPTELRVGYALRGECENFYNLVRGQP